MVAVSVIRVFREECSLNIEDIKKELNARGINWVYGCPYVQGAKIDCPDDLQGLVGDVCHICWKRYLEVEDNG